MLIRNQYLSDPERNFRFFSLAKHFWLMLLSVKVGNSSQPGLAFHEIQLVKKSLVACMQQTA